MATLATAPFNVQPQQGAGQLILRRGREGRQRIASHVSGQRSHENLIVLPEFSNDWALVQRAIAGDADSRENLFAPYASRLYRAAFAVLHNKQDAEDAVQEGLCKAFANLHSFRGRSTFSTWLTSIVKNAALMARRRQKSRPEASLDELVERQPETLPHTVVDSRPDPEQTCAASEIKALIDRGLQHLSPALQTALRLQVTKALSTADLGRSLGISTAAFKSRICRARRQVARELQRSLRATATA